jgi:serine/threonine protein kinase
MVGLRTLIEVVKRLHESFDDLLRRVPGDCDQEVVDLLNTCLSPDPASRPRATDLMCFLARHMGDRLQKELSTGIVEHLERPDVKQLEACEYDYPSCNANPGSFDDSESTLSLQSL